MQIKFDDRTLRALNPTEKRYDAVDKENTGLRLRVSPSGTKTFALVMRDPGGKLKTVTLGRYIPGATPPAEQNYLSSYGDRLSLASARRKAALMRTEISKGYDPAAKKRATRKEAEAEASRATTLAALLLEYQSGPGVRRKIWRSGEAHRRIGSVFAPLLSRDVRTITAEDFATAMADYKPLSGKARASGQVSKVRAYLSPVLNWTSGRGSFAKIGAHRTPRLDVASLAETHDPATFDDAIIGNRDRVLDEDELAALLRALKVVKPVRSGGRRGSNIATEGLSTHHGPALRFILLTACRLGELQQMRWRDINFERAEWFKPSVKSTRGPPRSQTLPLSQAAIDVLGSLPTFQHRKSDGLVFPTSTGGKLMNWSRATATLSRITGVKDWHRHDLRRTSATLMEAIGVTPRVIEQILAHVDPLKAEGVGKTAGVYVRLGRRFGRAEDPQRAALEKLARALTEIEHGYEIADVIQLGGQS
jgi:integrase